MTTIKEVHMSVDINISPRELRLLARKGEFVEPTSGYCPGYAQANLIILPKEEAYDFLLFAQRNPKACPLLEVTDVGSRMTKFTATDCDIATDFPKYRIYRDGVLTEEVTDISEYWQDDFVAFIIGCSFSFESEMIDAGIEIRHNTEGRNVPMYMTGIDCVPAGKFSGKMVVSMRPINPKQLVKTVTVTAQLLRFMEAQFILVIQRRLELRTLISLNLVMQLQLIQVKFQCSGHVALHLSQ